MPELPEVEITRRGIVPHIQGQTVKNVIVRNAKLRWPVQPRLKKELRGKMINTVMRRAKYLLLYTSPGTVILHLGMSGSLRIVPADTPPQKHDHVDIIFGNGKCLRLRDPRRFGAILWTRSDPYKHYLLKNIGPEPLGDEINGDYFFEQSRKRKTAIKHFVMNSRVIAGVGNIYACESLFRAGINPMMITKNITMDQCHRLSDAIGQVLNEAIKQGGTTLRDFKNSDGRPGYFKLSLRVYDRENQTCMVCGTLIARAVQQKRSTFYCPDCQSPN